MRPGAYRKSGISWQSGGGYRGEICVLCALAMRLFGHETVKFEHA